MTIKLVYVINFCPLVFISGHKRLDVCWKKDPPTVLD